jgi:predicted nucleic acid-binding protein
VSVVLDASMALAWCFADERTPEVEAASTIVAEGGAIVPALWRLEVANGLQSGVRRQRLTSNSRDELLRAFGDMDIKTDTETARLAWSATLSLADRHGLSVYDACYLELATRLTLPIASLDRALRSAASQEGLTCLPK